MDTSRAVRARPDVMVRDLDGESVLLDLRSGRYFGLDEVGARIWEVLVGSPSVDAAVATLLAEYEVTAEQLSADVADLIQELEREGLVELVLS